MKKINKRKFISIYFFSFKIKLIFIVDFLIYAQIISIEDNFQN